MSTQKIYDKTLEVIKSKYNKPSGVHLDIGSGRGELITFIKQHFQTESYACDYTDELMQISGQKVDIVDLNKEKMPYEDDKFDLVTCTEVLEHIEHYRETLREIHRISKKGAVAIFSTPNILNMKSRLRFLWFGFWNLFGPLHVKESRLHSTGGHINPVSYFYVAHALYDAGFEDISVTVDKYQRSSAIPYVLLYIPLKIFSYLAFRRELNRYKTIDECNNELVLNMNSMDILLGRTIIVSAKK